MVDWLKPIRFKNVKHRDGKDIYTILKYFDVYEVNKVCIIYTNEDKDSSISSLIVNMNGQLYDRESRESDWDVVNKLESKIITKWLNTHYIADTYNSERNYVYSNYFDSYDEAVTASLSESKMSNKKIVNLVVAQRVEFNVEIN